jgi:hypothetical protein
MTETEENQLYERHSLNELAAVRQMIWDRQVCVFGPGRRVDFGTEIGPEDLGRLEWGEMKGDPRDPLFVRIIGEATVISGDSREEMLERLAKMLGERCLHRLNLLRLYEMELGVGRARAIKKRFGIGQPPVGVAPSDQEAAIDAEYARDEGREGQGGFCGPNPGLVGR